MLADPDSAHAVEDAVHRFEANRPPIVFVVFQTGRRANGGVESITHVVEHLDGYRPVLVTQAETAATERWRSLGFEVHVWPVPDPPPVRGIAFWASRARRLLPQVAMNGRIAQLVRRLRAPLVHCNDIAAFWHAAVGAKLGGASVLFNIRSIFATGRRYGPKWQAAMLLADRVLVISEEMRTVVGKRIEPPLGLTPRVAPINRIYSYVDLTRMRPVSAEERATLRVRLGIQPDELAFGCIAAVSSMKRQLDFLRDAAPRLVREEPRARIWFVGDFDPERDEYARQCRDLVDALGLADRVRFVGYRADVETWYRALDGVFVTSRFEGLARCMIEAIACGTPVVSFDVCSAREILEGHDCGVVVPEEDFAGVARELAKLGKEPARRAALGERGARAAETLFDPSVISAKYRELYDEVVGARD